MCGHGAFASAVLELLVLCAPSICLSWSSATCALPHACFIHFDYLVKYVFKYRVEYPYCSTWWELEADLRRCVLK